MGNQPNNFIQCGQDQRDTKQQTLTTRQQAIRHTKPSLSQSQPQSLSQSQSQIPSTQIQSLSSTKSLHYQKPNPTNHPPPQSSSLSFIPEHQNIVKVSRVPKNKFVIVGDLYQEEPGKCLDEIIQARYHTTMHFPHYQIQGLLESLVYSLAYMVRKDVNYHDFYPTNIFYNNGAFKMANPALVKSSGYSLTQQRKRFSFLSPQLILQILNDTSQSNIRKDIMDKSDVFAIGMILLQFCTLTPSSQCYDPQTYNIVDEIINQRIEKTRALYNPLIADCIDVMLQYEVDKRISPVELAYAVHAKVREVRDDKGKGMGEDLGEMSRIGQMSRLAMSQAPHLVPGQNVRPASLVQNQVQGIPQQFMVSSNPKILPNPNPINHNLNPNLYMPNPIPYQPHIINPQIPTHINPPQQKPPARQLIDPPGFKRLQNSYYVTTDTKNLSPSKYSSNQPQPSTNLPQNITAKQSQYPAYGSNTKLKLNPFQQIQEDVKQDEEQSPERKKMENKAQVIGQQEKERVLNQSPKFGTYKFKNGLQPGMITSAAYLSPENKKEETLDERVKRILQASKNIK